MTSISSKLCAIHLKYRKNSKQWVDICSYIVGDGIGRFDDGILTRSDVDVIRAARTLFMYLDESVDVEEVKKFNDLKKELQFYEDKYVEHCDTIDKLREETSTQKQQLIELKAEQAITKPQGNNLQLLLAMYRQMAANIKLQIETTENTLNELGDSYGK